METAQLKSEFHQIIDTFEDKSVLEEFFLALKSLCQKGAKKDIIDELSPAQQEELMASLQQAKEGNTIPHEEMKKRMKEWREK